MKYKVCLSAFILILPALFMSLPTNSNSQGHDYPGIANLDNCKEIETAYYEELKFIQSCENSAECGQPITGSSCGCSRNLVAKIDSDLTKYNNLLSMAESNSCSSSSYFTTCDCPKTQGFVCMQNTCAWNYVDTEIQGLLQFEYIEF